MKKFWHWARNQDDGARTLYLNGVIAEEGWFEDDITPALFKSELQAGKGPVTIWLNSPGGDCVAAARIYNMLMDYPSDVTVQIDGIAASAASVVAMAGTRVLMSPVSVMMIHNPLTVAMGDSEEMRRAIQMLDEFKDSILNAYELKTGLSRTRLSNMMDAETWLSAGKAIELHFADGILFTHQTEEASEAKDEFTFSRRAATNSLLDKLRGKYPVHDTKPGVPVADLDKRLGLLLSR